jgi:DNA polymerase
VTHDSIGSELERLRAEALVCTRCPLADTRKHVVFGAGNPAASLLLVGEAPGTKEDESGLPFVGPSGDEVDGFLDEIGLTRDDVYIANVVKCRPPHNRKPRLDEIAACAPYLDAQLRLVDPSAVLALGVTATARLLGRPVRLKDVRGQGHRSGNAIVVPTFHPSAINRRAGRRQEVAADFRRAIQASLPGR